MIQEADEEDLERGSDAVDISVHVPDNGGETWTPKIPQTLTDSTSGLYRKPMANHTSNLVNRTYDDRAAYRFYLPLYLNNRAKLFI